VRLSFGAFISKKKSTLIDGSSDDEENLNRNNKNENQELKAFKAAFCAGCHPENQ
jgi:hypothetical protein